jgi:hypothetical protein
MRSYPLFPITAPAEIASPFVREMRYFFFCESLPNLRMIFEEKLATLRQTPIPESFRQKASTMRAFSRTPYP